MKKENASTKSAQEFREAVAASLGVGSAVLLNLIDAQYTVAPFLKPVHELGIPILGRVRNNRCFYLPPPRQAEAIYDERFSVEHGIRFLKGELGATCGQFNGKSTEGRAQV